MTKASLRLLVILALLLLGRRVFACQDSTYATYDVVCEDCVFSGNPGHVCKIYKSFFSCRDGSSITRVLNISTNCQPIASPPPQAPPMESGCTPPTDQCAEGCDGFDNNHDGVADEGCDDRQCHQADPLPVNYATGFHRSTVRSDFMLPSYDDIPVGFTRTWVDNDPAMPGLLAGDTALSGFNQIPTFVGWGWRFLYGDELILTSNYAGTRPDAIAWKANESLQFGNPVLVTAASPQYWKYVTPEDRGYELRFYGDGSGPTARIVRLTDNMVWEFQFIPGAFAFNKKTVAFLTKIARPQDRATFVGGYYITLARDAQGRILSSCDAENPDPVNDPSCASSGRKLTFEYGTGSRLLRIKNGSTVLVEFVYSGTFDDRASTYLERVRRFDGGTYERYLYQDITDANGFTTRRLSAVIAPLDPALEGSPPAADSPLQPGELAVESHVYASDGRVLRSTSAALDYGYTYGATATIQYDLNQPVTSSGNLVACSNDTPCGGAGFGCWLPSAVLPGGGYCYRTNIMYLDMTRTLVTGSSGTCSDCGVSTAFEASPGSLYIARTTDQGGVRTTRSWDPIGRIRCTVIGDDNDTAEVGGACEGPSTARIERHQYTDDPSGCGYSETVTLASAIPVPRPPRRPAASTAAVT